MAVVSALSIDDVRQKFPLKTVDAVVDVFRDQLVNRVQPDLAFLSILLGILEQSLTVNRSAASFVASVSGGDDDGHLPPDNNTSDAAKPTGGGSVDSRQRMVDCIPSVELSDVEVLYEQFVALIKGSVDLSLHKHKYTSPELLKTVSDVIWTVLTRTYYKDRAHLHSLYTMLTDNKMDCFGMAVGVLAACQVLGLSDVHLAFSEDHAWAVFGKDGHLSAEITWHGKGTEDRRGLLITEAAAEKCWLYSYPLIGNRHIEVAAMVLNINPAINASYDSVEMATLQQRLLWLLYDFGHLEKYPLALGILADMEEMSPIADRPLSIDLYTAAIDVAKNHYANMLVYPYTYIGNYYYRRCMYKEALRNWAAAAKVISRYNYNREDEEIYKEFLEIANDIIPNIIRISSGETSEANNLNNSESKISMPFLSDPECYANLLQLYDGICEWEEGSSKPVLHIVWANHMAYSISKFDLKARENVNIEAVMSVNGSGSESGETEPRKRVDRRRESDSTKEEGTKVSAKSFTSSSEAAKAKQRRVRLLMAEHQKTKALDAGSSILNINVDDAFSKREDSISEEKDWTGPDDDDKVQSHSREVPTSLTESLNLVPSKEAGIGEAAQTQSVMSNEVASMNSVKSIPSELQTDTYSCDRKQSEESKLKLVLYSEKMVGMKDLLVCRKLNTSAIKLQLTAQSQLSLKQSQPTVDSGLLVKRIRRE